MISVTIEPSVEDVINFTYSNWLAPFNKRNRTTNFFVLFFSGFLGSSTAFFLENFFTEDLATFTEIIIVLIISVATALYFKFYALKNSIAAKVRKEYNNPSNRNTYGRSQLTITEDGITGINDASKVECKWSAIVKVLETKDYYFLYINSIQAFIIPRQLLNSDQLVLLDGYVNSKISPQLRFKLK